MSHPALVRTRAVPALLAAMLLATLLAPVPRQLVSFLLPAGADLPAGSHVLQDLSVADALLVTGPTVPAGAVPADEPLGFRSLSAVPDAAGRVLDSGVASTGAPDVWPTTTGERAVVALVDTGVAPIPALSDAVAGEIDFTGTGGGDGYGHGTYMASLIAARGDRAPGVAPATGVLSLKVADDAGATDLGRVMSALQWLHGPGRAAGIRVATLALGVDADSPAATLLDLATSRLAADGVLVVTAAGNDGPDALSSPATAPGTFSVGAVNDQGTADRSDDVAAPFSATGSDRVGVVQPDVRASGVDVVGWMPADATIATSHPEALVGDGLIRGSGTSMATALAAGVAALVSSARPDLDGAGLDAALRAGEGQLDAVAALDAALQAPARPQPTAGQRPASPPAAQANSKGSAHRSEQAAAASIRWRFDWDGEAWDSIRWRSIRWRAADWGTEEWGSARWGSIRWRSIRWRGDHWGDEGWDLARWGSIRWRGAGWVGDPYDTDVEWDSIRWRSIRWASIRWASVDWS